MSQQNTDQQKGLATFYAYLGPRATRKPIGDSIERLPADWGELKHLLMETMMIVHVEHHVDECQLSLEKHLAGRFLYRTKGGYGQGRTRWRREVLGIWKVVYNYTSNNLTVRASSFGWELTAVAQEYWWMERGIRFKTPRLIPKELEHPKITMFQPSPQRYADYSKIPRQQYAANSAGGYPATSPLHVCHYLPRNLRQREAAKRMS